MFHAKVTIQSVEALTIQRGKIREHVNFVGSAFDSCFECQIDTLTTKVSFLRGSRGIPKVLAPCHW